MSNHADFTPIPFGDEVEQERLITIREVSRLIGLQDSQTCNLTKTGHLPKPRRVGNRSKRWLLSEIMQYIHTRPEVL